MPKKYGITWWGQQWLKAFNHISDENRLPRGRSYANTGKVKEVDFKRNKILAKVRGSRLQPYSVKIIIPSFTRKQRLALLELVKDDPLYLSQLLNNELPPRFEQACKDRGIDIFPESWNDLKASCSCPDWAMPCKHLAAVLYLVANEIDKNPFLVFALHDCNLIEELESANLGLRQNRDLPILKTMDLWTKEAQEAGTDKSQQPADLSAYDQIDFSSIPQCANGLLSILGDYPVFYPNKDFKEILAKLYTTWPRLLKRHFSKREVKPLEIAYEEIDQIRIHCTVDLEHFETLISQNGELSHHLKSVRQLCDFLDQLPVKKLDYCVPELQTLYFIERLARKLVQQSALHPQLLETSDRFHKIRWIPALINEEIRDTVDLLADMVPKDLITVNGASLSTANRAVELLSMFLSHYVFVFSEKIQRQDRMHELFFAGRALSFSGFEEHRIPKSIQLWLNQYFILEKPFVPVLKVTDNSAEEFEVEVLIQNQQLKTHIPISLKDLFAQELYDKHRLHILRDLAMIGRYFPALESVISTRGEEVASFDADQFATVLFQILPIIRLFGIKVLLPKSLRKIARPKLSLSVKADDGNVNKGASGLNLASILNFDWQLALGDQFVSIEEFRRMVSEMSGIVKHNEQYLFFDENEVRALLENLEDPPSISPRELLQIALSEEYDGGRISFNKNAKRLIDEIKELKKVKAPKGLKASLRPYQQRGFEWMYKNSQLGFGSLLADDMGLGKTIQVITTILKLKEEGLLKKKKALVIVPTTLLSNWQREIARFAPSMAASVYHGSSRKLVLEDFDVIITSYGVVRSDSAKLCKLKWAVLVIDESQNIKNPSTIQTKAVKKIKADTIIAMSGTPVENRLAEYWSVFDFTNKSYLGSLANFKKSYAVPIEVDRNLQVLERFRKITAPFILRRLKSDKSIIKDLPDKIEKDHFCKLTSEQVALYESVVKENLKQVEISDGIQRRGLVLKLITALKQVCNHPTHFLKSGPQNSDLSGKAMATIALQKRILESAEKTLIFTQYREMGELLQQMLVEELNLKADFLHGGVSRKKRDEMVADLQHNHSSKVLILSLKAGGTGLNLTAASNVIHYDLWWNPAVEAQATDRVYRIGQKKKVQVHRLICQNTFEEKINALIQKKKELADMTVSTGEKWIGDLSNQELHELLVLEDS